MLENDMSRDGVEDVGRMINGRVALHSS
ncbi:hypothetical protein A2U01_0090008, partial [Trifolium medium]|nr:hypothetical protein [Trifolium medium]